jgi:hypothetical protein
VIAPSNTADQGSSIGRSLRALRQTAPGIALVSLLGWLVIVAAAGALLTLQSLGYSVGGEAKDNRATPEMWWTVGLICFTCLAAALITRRLQSAATLPVTFATGGVMVLAGAIGTGSVGSLLLVTSLFGLAWLLGETLLSRFPATAVVPVVRIPMATGLGLGLFGLLLLLLATLGALNTATVVAGTGLILLAVVLVDGARLAAMREDVRSWRPASPTWFETVVVGLMLGGVSYATLAALLPEIHSDAIRQHLPAAREIWQAGAAPEFAFLGVTQSPIQAHLLYAVSYGLGDMTAAKLVHTLVGLLTILGVAGIGCLTSGRVAATVGAAVFATMPLVLWELGTAYVDLFPAFFAVATVLCVLLWQRDGWLGWLVAAGFLAGVGFAAKLTLGFVIVSVAVAIALVGRGPWRWRDRVVAVAAFGLGGVVIVPWLLRSYFITGTIPGLSILADHAVGTATSDLSGFGLGRSPLDLLSIPWQLTFHGEEFQQSGGSDVGFLLLLLLPAVLLVPRTRSLAFLAITAGLSFLGWAFTAQYTRYFLPTLAVASALAGIGLASVLADSVARVGRPLARALPIGVILGLVAAPMLYLPGSRALVPINVLTGRESAQDYVAGKVGAAAALAAASELLPPDTPVGYFGVQREGAQLYTEARLTYFEADPINMTPGGVLIDLDLLGTRAEAVLASLQRLDIDYFIWNRGESRPQDWRSTLLSTPFLRTHTRILAGDRSGYLFELLPPGGSDWGQSQPNLLADPGLEHVGADGPWRVTEPVRTRKGVVSLRPKSVLGQRVPVTAETPYLLLATATCETPADRAVLTLRWFDDHAVELGVTEEWVLPGTAGSDQFLWHLAPPRAATVSVELTTTGGARCDVDEAALYASP